jgi:hypothetical protein
MVQNEKGNICIILIPLQVFPGLLPMSRQVSGFGGKKAIVPVCVGAQSDFGM